MEKEYEELQKIYPEATIYDLHNMIQELKKFCVYCIEASIQAKQIQVANDNEKIPEKSS